MAQSDSQTEKNVDGILEHLSKYLGMRFSHAKRLNPRFGQIEIDLKWHELVHVRFVISQTKSFGEFRHRVADIMTSFDAEKKRAIFSPSDQNSIMQQLVTQEEEAHAKTSGATVQIRDLQSLYHAIDPALQAMVELLESWVWWDLRDAADMFHLSLRFKAIRKLMQTELNDKMVAHYRQLLKGESIGALNKGNILIFEFKRTESLLDDFANRREIEEIQEQLIARESTGNQSLDSDTIQLAQHIRATKRLQDPNGMDSALRDYYAKALHCPPEKVTTQDALEFEHRYIVRAREELAQALHGGGAAGEPFNFKERELREARNKLAALKSPKKDLGSAPPPMTSGIIGAVDLR